MRNPDNRDKPRDMVTKYSKILPSTHIYKSFDAANAAIARATVNSYSRAPRDGFDRYTHAAGLYAGVQFIDCANGTGALFWRTLGTLNTITLALNMEKIAAPFQQLGAGVWGPHVALMGVFAAAAAVGTGPQATARARMENRDPSTYELLGQYGIIGYLEHVAARAAEEAAQSGNTKTSHAAYACALGIALVLEPLRAPLACLLVLGQVLMACWMGLLGAVVGVIAAACSSRPTAYHLEQDMVDLAADIIGAEHPVPPPLGSGRQPPFDSSFFDFDFDLNFEYDESDDESVERLEIGGSGDASTYGYASSTPHVHMGDNAGYSFTYDRSTGPQPNARYRDNARAHLGAAPRLATPLQLSKGQAIKACQRMLTQLRAASDRDERYGLIEMWSRSSQKREKIAALAGHVGRSDRNMFGHRHDRTWLSAVLGAYTSPENAKSYLRQIALTLHPDKLSQQGSHLSQDAQKMGEHLYMICDYANTIRASQPSRVAVPA